MSTPWTRAADRLREVCQVRVVQARPREQKLTSGHHVSRIDAVENRAMVRELLAQGLTLVMIADIVDISRTAVQRHVKAIRAGKLQARAWTSPRGGHG